MDDSIILGRMLSVGGQIVANPSPSTARHRKTFNGNLNMTTFEFTSRLGRPEASLRCADRPKLDFVTRVHLILS